MASDEDARSWPLNSLFDCHFNCSVQHLIEIAAVGNRKCLGIVGLHSSSDIFRAGARAARLSFGRFEGVGGGQDLFLWVSGQSLDGDGLPRESGQIREYVV